MKKHFSKLEQEFIKDLAHEMKTQDTRCTAQPYGLVISTEHIQYGFESVNAEFTGYYDREDCENYYHEEDFNQFIEDITPMLSEEELEELTEKIEKFAIKSFHYLDLFCSDIVPSRYEVQGYKKVRTADSTDGCYEGNFFLTEKAANNYIKRNKHNLSNPETYGIHLYRNPEMENLYNIIHKLAKAIEEEENN